MDEYTDSTGGSLLSVVRRRWHDALATPGFLSAVLRSTLLLLVSIVAAFYAIGYATISASNAVTDIVLSNIPILDVDGLFVWGSLLLVATIVVVLLLHPKRIPFVFASLALFYIIRSGFTILTHLGPYPVPSEYAFNFNSLVGRFLTGKDMFFSGHTGMPFMLALVFWRDRFWRYVFLAWSIFMAVIVLLGHLHYSIDVGAAFFITYTIYHIACAWFSRDLTLFESSLPGNSI